MECRLVSRLHIVDPPPSPRRPRTIPGPTGRPASVNHVATIRETMGGINIDPPSPIDAVHLVLRQLIGGGHRERHKVLLRPDYLPIGARPVVLRLMDLAVALWHSQVRSRINRLSGHCHRQSPHEQRMHVLLR